MVCQQQEAIGPLPRRCPQVWVWGLQVLVRLLATCRREHWERPGTWGRPEERTGDQIRNHGNKMSLPMRKMTRQQGETGKRKIKTAREKSRKVMCGSVSHRISLELGISGVLFSRGFLYFFFHISRGRCRGLNFLKHKSQIGLKICNNLIKLRVNTKINSSEVV